MEIETLKKEIQELQEWRSREERQQLNTPLDETSKRLLQEGALVYKSDTDVKDFFFTDILSRGLVVTIDGLDRVIVVTVPMIKFTVNTTTNVITADTLHSLENGNKVAFATSDDLPAGISETTEYFVINATGKTFQISTTSGGSAVNITSAGTGNHYFGRIK